MGNTSRHATARLTAPRSTASLKWLPLAAATVAMLALAPRLGTTAAASDAGTQALQLEIGAAGSYRLDGKPVTRDGLEQALRTARGASPALRLRIEASDNVDPQQLIGALALADQAGIRNVGSRVQ